jgi:hypothetical protein
LDHCQSSSDLHRSLPEVVGYFLPSLIFRISQIPKNILRDFVKNIVQQKNFPSKQTKPQLHITQIVIKLFHLFRQISPENSHLGEPESLPAIAKQGYDPKGTMQSRAYT